MFDVLRCTLADQAMHTSLTSVLLDVGDASPRTISGSVTFSTVVDVKRAPGASCLSL